MEKPITMTYKNIVDGTTKTITVLSFLGQGTSARVFKCMLDGYGLVACKFFTKLDENEIKNELRISKLFPDEDDHILNIRKILLPENLVSIFSDFPEKIAIIKDYNNPILLFKYIDGLKLSEVIDIKIKARSSIEIDVLKNYMRQLLLGLQILQSKRLAHRDIKPDNIMLSEGNLIYIDFGFACILEDCRAKLLTGTPNYVSPQVIKGNMPQNDAEWFAIDIFALGLTFFEMIVRKTMVPLAFKLYLKLDLLNRGLLIMQYRGRDLNNLKEMFYTTIDICVKKEPFITLLKGMLNTNEKERFSVEKCLEIINN